MFENYSKSFLYSEKNKKIEMEKFTDKFNPILIACKIFLVFPPKTPEKNLIDKIKNIFYTLSATIIWGVCFYVFLHKDDSATYSPSSLAQIAIFLSSVLGMLFMFFITIKSFMKKKKILKIFQRLMEIEEKESFKKN